MKSIFFTNSLKDNQQIIDEIINSIEPDMFILLTGDLGAGKTTFTKMLLKTIGVDDTITSPTFNILQQYKTRNGLTVNHMDAYRLNKSSDIEMFIEHFDESINIIEWWENLNFDFSNKKIIKIFIDNLGEKRKLTVERM